MRTFLPLILLLTYFFSYGQIQNPPYVGCDDIIPAMTIENHDELIFNPDGRLLLLQPLSELHIWNRLSTENIPDAAFIFGRTGNDSLDSYSAKIIFHNCDSYFNAGEWTDPDTGETRTGEIHFDRGYGDTGDLGLTSGKIEVIFECETLSDDEVKYDEYSDKELYEFNSKIYNIKGQLLYKGKFGNAFYNDRISEYLRQQLIFIQIIVNGQPVTVRKRIYKY